MGMVMFISQLRCFRISCSSLTIWVQEMEDSFWMKGWRW